ncbi:RNA polymerase II transcription factor B subunit 3 [Iris pallida]|uniref:RNA polymerase II transcription factor B subunit 3 n=1 Tax=Iris pallida TaxID=29817 RepID=A0AAX6I5W8_IRIPA|nr:RNA polymerase II transcription factor B subunit 3 [Iris pallida]KAJ6848599.1 RNA polymerase II transcription factor B subunit 3 [Iris pallida]
MVSSSSKEMAKEMATRRRMAGIFNKMEDEFPSLRDYNDYLEEVEDMTFNLIEGNDVAAIEAKIARYQEENADQIINSRARRAEELVAALKASRAHNANVDAVDVSGGQTTQGVSGVGAGVQGQYAPATIPGAGLGQPRPTQPVPLGGHNDPMHADPLRAERAASAGGWTVELSKKRALEEAFSSIWI